MALERIRFGDKYFQGGRWNHVSLLIIVYMVQQETGVLNLKKSEQTAAKCLKREYVCFLMITNIMHSEYKIYF